MFQHAQNYFRALKGVFQHLEKELGHSTASGDRKFFCVLEKHAVMLKSNNKHAKPLFIVLIYSPEPINKFR